MANKSSDKNNLTNTTTTKTTETPVSLRTANLRQEKIRTNEGQVTSIPVVEENLQVGKREVQRGGVHVESRIVERPVQEQVTLREEHVHVERRPVDRPVNPGELQAFREGSIDVVERAEEAVVAKQARVVEEVLVGKETTVRTEQIRETLRHTEVSIDRLGGMAKGAQFRPFESFDTDFRSDFSSNYARNGINYDHYTPLYRYGYDIATSQRFAGRDWNLIEPEARTAWEERNPGTWDQVKNAIRYAWMRVTGRLAVSPLPALTPVRALA